MKIIKMLFFIFKAHSAKSPHSFLRFVFEGGPGFILGSVPCWLHGWSPPPIRPNQNSGLVGGLIALANQLMEPPPPHPHATKISGGGGHTIKQGFDSADCYLRHCLGLYYTKIRKFLPSPFATFSTTSPPHSPTLTPQTLVTPHTPQPSLIQLPLTVYQVQTLVYHPPCMYL